MPDFTKGNGRKLFTISRQKFSRLELLQPVRSGEPRLSKAAELSGLSRRQARRACERYREGGTAELMHRVRRSFKRLTFGINGSARPNHGLADG